jgi:DNA-binding NtrC family response regulator
VRQLENLIKRMVVLGTEEPIRKELQQPPAPLPFRHSSSSASSSRPVTPPQPAMPPPAVAAVPPSAAAFASMPASVEEPMGAGVSAAVSAGLPAGANSVSLKDIARTAAREAERELILRMLTRTRWNRKEAAEILGISYKALLYKIKENGLDKAS